MALVNLELGVSAPIKKHLFPYPSMYILKDSEQFHSIRYVALLLILVAYSCWGTNDVDPNRCPKISNARMDLELHILNKNCEVFQ